MKFGNLKEIKNLYKAYTEGIYSDTPQNRKLGRVGMTYAEYANKINKEKDNKIKEKYLLDLDKSTEEQFKENGRWNKERTKLHKKIIDKYLSKITSTSKNPTVTLMMGAPASGKGTVRAFLDKEKSTLFGDVTVDPDDIKTKELKEDYDAYFKHNPKEAAKKLHEESSYIGNEIINKIINKKANFSIDKVFYDYDKLLNQIKELKEKGYKVNLIYVGCDKDVAFKRMIKRGNETGRFVPFDYFNMVHNIIRSTYNKIKNDSHF